MLGVPWQTENALRQMQEVELLHSHVRGALCVLAWVDLRALPAGKHQMNKLCNAVCMTHRKG